MSTITIGVNLAKSVFTVFSSNAESQLRTEKEGSESTPRESAL